MSQHYNMKHETMKQKTFLKKNICYVSKACQISETPD